MASLRDNANIGRRLRELRLERGLQQADVARTLGVSGAYLNLLEKGKRTVQLPLLWKALSFFGIEMEAFMASLGERRAPDALAKLLDEPLLRSLGITNEDILDFSGEPKRTAMLVALFNLYKNTRTQLEQVATRLAEEQQDGGGSGGAFEKARLSYSPLDEITDFLQSQRNYFAELEDEARAHPLRSQARAAHPLRRARQDLEGAQGARRVPAAGQGLGGAPLRSEEAPPGDVDGAARAADRSSSSRRPSACACSTSRSSTSGWPWRSGPSTRETPRLIKIHLANYFAGALLLPYEDFIGEVERTRYDIELLSNLFEMSYEAVAHRVCNLGDPKRPGIPHALRPLRRGRQHLQALLGDGAALPRGVGLVRQVGGAQRLHEPVDADAAVFDDARRRRPTSASRASPRSRCRARSCAARPTRSASAPTPTLRAIWPTRRTCRTPTPRWPFRSA